MQRIEKCIASIGKPTKWIYTLQYLSKNHNNLGSIIECIQDPNLHAKCSFLGPVGPNETGFCPSINW